MEATIKWFDYSKERSDIENVMGFLRELPSNIKIFVDPKTTTFKVKLNEYEDFGVSFSLFEKVITEASEEYNLGFIKLNRSMKLDAITKNNSISERMASRLKKNGLTGDSLSIKANMLNFLWNNVTRKVDKLGADIIDISNKDNIKLLRKFFGFLNSLLGSIVIVFPFVEPIKETKDIIEAFLGVADD